MQPAFPSTHEYQRRREPDYIYGKLTAPLLATAWHFRKKNRTSFLSTHAKAMPSCEAWAYWGRTIEKQNPGMKAMFHLDLCILSLQLSYLDALLGQAPHQCLCFSCTILFNLQESQNFTWEPTIPLWFHIKLLDQISLFQLNMAERATRRNPRWGQ